jgi:hypothetical protein
VQVRILPGSPGRTATGAVPRFENGWASGPWGFDSLSFRFVPVWSSGKTRDCYSRGAGSIPAAGAPCPRGRTGDDAGLSTRKLRVRVPPGVLRLAVGELATPPVLGAGDRRFDSCRPDLRGRGEAVLASLMSSRPWVRIPPALLTWTRGCSSDEQSARLSGERPPVRVRSSPLMVAVV